MKKISIYLLMSYYDNINFWKSLSNINKNFKEFLCFKYLKWFETPEYISSSNK